MNEELENFSKKKCSFCKQTSYKIIEKYGLLVCENCKERVEYMTQFLKTLRREDQT
jgi:ribosomal protein L37AE/L43A